MKKLITALSASALALSVVLFSACSIVSKDGSISGNYREAEDADIQQLLTTFSEGDVFGDMDAEGWRYGLHGEASLDVAILQDVYQMSAGLDADLGILFETVQQEVSLSAGGSLGVSSEVKNDGKVEASVDADIQPYINDDYLYLHMSGKSVSSSGETSLEQRGKIKMGGLGTLLPIPNLEELPELISGAFSETIEPAVFRAQLDSAGVSMDVDTSSGFKARFTYSAAGVAEVVREALGSVADIDTSAYTPILGSDTLEMYLMIDEQGLLSAVSMRVDISVTVQEPEYSFFDARANEEAGALTFAIKGMFAITSDDADIVFPSDLSSYPDFNIFDLI